jgi:hypothetical protein
MRPSPFSASVLFCAAMVCFGLCVCCRAQQSNQPSLEQVFTQLQQNMETYLTGVPDFFADEHVDSSMEQANYDGKIITVTDSVFRLRRVDDGRHTTLEESREIKAVNQKRPKNEMTLTGPAVFRGAFSNGIRLVSLDMTSCFEYQRVADARMNGVNAIVVTFTALADAAFNNACPRVNEGRAYVDPQSFRLLRVEARVPNHEITFGVVGLWTWSIDYAPVTLEGRTFWLPKTIESSAVPNDRRLAWSFVAKYSNYHKLEVNSHIITDLGNQSAPPPQ